MLQFVVSSVHYTTNCNTQSSAPEDGQNNFAKHVELTGIINKPLLLHLVGCLYYLYQWCTVKQILDNEIYLLIKYIKSVLWRAAKCLSYIEEARCLKVKSSLTVMYTETMQKGHIFAFLRKQQLLKRAIHLRQKCVAYLVNFSAVICFGSPKSQCVPVCRLSDFV